MKTKHFKLSCLFLLILFVTQSCVVSSLHPLYTDSDRVHLDELDGVWMEEDKTRYEITTIVDSTGLEVKKDKTNPKGMSKEEAFFNGSGGKKKKASIEEENEFFEGKSKKRNISDADKNKIENFFFNPQLRKHYQIKIFSEKDTSIFDGKLSKLDGNYFLDIIPNEKCLENKLEESYMSALIARTHGFFKLDIKDDELMINGIEYDDFEELLKKKRIRIEYVERDDNIIITAKTPDIQKFLIKFADDKMFNDPKEALILKRIKN